MAVELLNRIESQLGVSVPTADVMSGPTVAKLAALLAGSFGGSAPPTESEEQENPVASDSAAEMRAAVRWDHEIEANLPTVSGASVIGPSAILLTGATGFLGAYLLRELLERTNADIYCLVRAADPETALNRIEENLNRYGQRRSGHAARIIPVTGDLEKARFGFSEKQFNALAQTIDVIHHCGALVRHLSPYASQETANVAGTREILRFASSVKMKPVHYVSTLAVFNLDGSPEDRVIHEADEPDDVASLMGGYAESKWVAEAVVRLAGAKGVPVAIYRPGLITGDSVTGVSTPDDFIWRLVRDCIELGAAPDTPTPLYLTPVNYVAAGIAQLSIQPVSIGGIYHLINPCSPTLRDILSFARSIGYPMREIPLAEWEKMAATARAGAAEANSLRPYLLLYPEAKKESLRNATRMPRFDCSAALTALTGSGIKCPPVDEAMLRLVFEQFVQSGSWPAPAADSSSSCVAPLL
jgi:thioester reductase-like protein